MEDVQTSGPAIPRQSLYSDRARSRVLVALDGTMGENTKTPVLERYLQHFAVEEFSRYSMVERYKKYNDDVIGYFKGTAKLLVLNLEEGDGWTQLCTFLDEPKRKTTELRSKLT